ncbi:MAG: glycosyltransferase [Calditrichaceae bacterium]
MPGLILLILLSIYLVGLAVLSNGLNHLGIKERTDKKPRVSVIISARNEEKNLSAALKYLSAQSYPKDLIEFIIVNDRSTDRTEEIIIKYCADDPRFRLITIKDRLPGFAPKKRAIDTAIKSAKGEIILLTDADGRPGSRWAETMVSYFTGNTDMVLGYAPYASSDSGSSIQKMLAIEYLSHAAIAASSTGLGYPVTCVGTNMAYRKKLYIEIGGFGEFEPYISGDDDLFLTRVREAGKYRIRYAPGKTAHVYNDPPETLSSFFHQRMRYASKGFDYPVKVTLGLISLFAFNLMIFTGISTYFFSPLFFKTALFVYAAKTLSEFLFMKKAARVLNDMRNLDVFFLAALLHIPYVIFFGIAGQFKQFRWAEASVESALQTDSTQSA